MAKLLPRSIQIFLSSRPAVAAVWSNAGWLVIEKMVRMILALVVGAWVARHLGPDQFGQLAYALTFVVLFQGVVNLSADGILVRDLARHPEDAAALLGSVLRLRIATGVLCWVLLIGLVHLLRPTDPEATTLAAIVGISMLFQSAETIDIWFQSQSRNRPPVLAKLASYIVSNAIRVSLILSEAPLWAFAATTAIEAALLGIALASVYRRFPTRERWRMDLRLTRVLLTQVWPFILSSIAAAIYLRADQVIIREAVGDRALGIYASALQPSQVWNFLPVILVTSLAPAISRLRAKDLAEYERGIVLIFRLFFYLGLLISIALSLTAQKIVHILFGPEFRDAAQVLSIHAFTNVFVFLGLAHNLWLLNSGKPIVRLVGTVVAGLSSVASNWFLIPKFGVVAAAYVAVGSQAVVTFLINAVLAPRSFILQLQAITFLRFVPFRRGS